MRNDNDQTVPEVLKTFAELLGTEIINRRFEIPVKFGKGYCAGFVFNADIRMLIFNYELRENLVINNPDTITSARTILFKFQNIFPARERLSVTAHVTPQASVLIANRRMDPGVVIPIHTNTATINIEVDAHYLDKLFGASERSFVLKSLLQNMQPLLFEQMIDPSLQKIVDEMIAEPVDEMFKLFFLKIKAEELICRLLMNLERRDEKELYALNTEDVRIIYKIRDQILEQPGTPPVISALAIGANMSPTKLKRLFRQIFGNSIFNYYQASRMKEAARLLKEKKLSVSDVGYSLGFTNLGHFSRVFKEHIGMNPKQYSTHG